MFDRLQKPFLTVETGEAYQPVRLTYALSSTAKERLLDTLSNMQCIQANTAPNSWTWYWKAECDDLHFESLDSFRRNPQHPSRLGTFTLREDKLYLNLPSFKRACLAIPFFYRIFDKETLTIRFADFINKVFALDERLPHGFTELFKDEELDAILNQRVEDYEKVKEQCEQAATAEQAFSILSDYTQAEASKRLPYAERYEFQMLPEYDPEILFLGFYIFLRGREIVAISRWFGQSSYSLMNAAEDVVEEVFGGLGIDLLEE